MCDIVQGDPEPRNYSAQYRSSRSLQEEYDTIQELQESYELSNRIFFLQKFSDTGGLYIMMGRELVWAGSLNKRPNLV